MFQRMLVKLAGTNSAFVLSLIKALIRKLSAPHITELILFLNYVQAAAAVAEHGAAAVGSAAEQAESFLTGGSSKTITVTEEKPKTG